MAQMLIAGELSRAAGGAEMAVLNPANEEVVDSVPQGDVADVDAAVGAAERAFRDWSRLDPDKRASLMRAGLERVRAEGKAIVDLLVREHGKPTSEAQGEFHHFLHGMEFYADLASKIRGSYAQLPSTLGTSFGFVIKRPMGVVAALVPYNFPLTLMGTKVGPALAAGNTIVVKPASTTPLATLRIAELFHEAGLPAGVLNVVTGPGRVVGEALAGHPSVRRVAFTGGNVAGERIIAIAGPRLKRVTLELGGSDPVIVCPDADVTEAVKGVLIGRFFNAGQACLAAKRVYVFAEVYDAFMAELLKRVARYELGEGWTPAQRPNIRMGPLNNAQQCQELDAQVQDAVGRGARLACGTETARPERGFYYPPTVVEAAPHDSRLVREEVFGPVLPVFRVQDMDEAIRLANDSIYGLGSSIWTQNIRWIHRAAQEIEAGMTWVNQLHYGYDELPFGGVKASGIGREHGQEGLEEYLETKSIVVGGLG